MQPLPFRDCAAARAAGATPIFRDHLDGATISTPMETDALVSQCLSTDADPADLA